jgi:hypothetical protein
VNRVVLCIHGIRTTSAAIPWQRESDAALRIEGLATTDRRGWKTLTPEYMDLLDADPEPRVEEPVLTHMRADDEGEIRAAGAYWLACSRLERALGDSTGLQPGPLADVPADQMAELAIDYRPVLAQAKRYCASAGRRHAIQARLLDALDGLPHGTELVIVGYSLGSVVAADLLYHLPSAYRVRLLVTIGSPVHLKEVSAHLRRIKRSFPFELGAPWLNLVGQWDRAAAGRGISHVFPEVLDIYVDTGIRGAHNAERYLAQPALARAFVWADSSTELRPSGHLPELALDNDLLPLVILNQYALRLAQAQKAGAQRTRFEQARALLLDEVAEQVRHHGGALPITDHLGEDHAALLNGRLHDNPIGLVDALLSVHTSNPVAPYEIAPPADAKKKALRSLAADLGVPTRWADVVTDVVEDARDAHDGFPWEKAVLGAAALALLAVAPYMVLAAAPAELAGGAAIVGGLAALGGAGGMMGGLALVGFIGGAGGVAAAGALTTGSAAVVAQRVVFLQARAGAGAGLGHRDPGTPEWFALIGMRSLLDNEHARHHLLDDRKSATMEELNDKLKAVDTAIQWLAANGLGPPQLGGPGGGPSLPAGED